MYAAVRQIGEIFNVRNVAEQLVSEIQNDFEIAEQSVKSLKTELKAIWLDCVDCCTDETGEKTGLYVGAGTGAPNLIMQEAGMKNVFAGTDGSWTCATASDILATKPDVMIIVDAAWDTAMSKIDFLHNHSDFCDADFVKGADYISIPFSASTLGPRNGAAALDMALAAIHVTTGSTTVDFKSGVNFISPDALEKRTVGLRCPVDASSIKYSEEAKLGKDSNPSENPKSDSIEAESVTDEMPSWAKILLIVFVGLFVAAVFFMYLMIHAERQGKPIFTPLLKAEYQPGVEIPEKDKMKNVAV